jgi:hypothetical protein
VAERHSYAQRSCSLGGRAPLLQVLPLVAVADDGAEDAAILLDRVSEIFGAQFSAL